MIPLVLLLSSTAPAGKLADGWRGFAYGDNPAILGSTPPLPTGCLLTNKSGARWLCAEEISGRSLQVAYMVSEGLFLGVLIRCEDTEACADLRAVAGALFDPGFRPRFSSDSGSLRDGFWFEGRSAAAWTYNPYTGKGSLVTTDLDVADAADDRTKARARKAAEGL